MLRACAPTAAWRRVWRRTATTGATSSRWLTPRSPAATSSAPCAVSWVSNPRCAVDNVANIHAALGQLGSRWPLLVLEEAQNFSASALEEVRLLTCACSDTRPPFSLLLIGEDSLLPRLQMGINHALISRLGFALPLTRLEPAQSREYVAARLRAVGVHSNPFEDQGLELLIQAASGLPRAINHLARACDRSRGRRRYANHWRDTRSSRSGPLTVAGL
jgi:type II secretory pathway predicted ATPase ExeA